MSPLPQSPQTSSSQVSPCYESSDPSHVHSHSDPEQSPRELHSLNLRLGEELKTVVIMNDKWQKYQKHQDKYVKDLENGMAHHHLKIQEMEKRLSQALTEKLQLKQKVKDQQEIIDSFGNLMDELDNAKQEVQILKLQEHNLQEKVNSFKGRTHTSHVGNSEKIEMLQLQLQACIDDFKKERKEKEKYHNDTTILLDKLDASQNLLQDYQEKIIIMRSINFPKLQEDQTDFAPIRKDANGYSRRNRKASSSSSHGACRLDYQINFPSSIVDDCAGSYHKGQSVELAACFPSLDSDDFEVGLGSDGIIGDRNVELVRH